MTWVAGVDGCRKGWFRIARDVSTGALAFDVLERASDLLDAAPRPNVIGLDMPIGLTASGPRECDRLARKLLGPRRSSVFPTPVRAALEAASREQACRINEKIDGRRVGVQSWAIYPKIRDVDAFMRESADARKVIWEVHPEVSFRAWNGGVPMGAAKKRRAGIQQRLALAQQWLGDEVLVRARGAHLKKHLADDDIVDAIAGLWTAHRLTRGEATSLPEPPETDEAGLPMRIVY